MAHTKAGGSTQYGRDSISKRLGIKKFSGEKVECGTILVRQRGTKIRAGKNVKKGEDDTLYAVQSGTVKFSKRKIKKFNGKIITSKIIQVI